MHAYTQSQLISDKGEMLKSICVDSPGFYAIANESGEPVADCVYSRLSREGYLGISLAIVDGEDWGSLEFSLNLACPRNNIVNKDRPDCLKITR